jgi:ABC-type siderophore export system fused ATPase/permease subunit
MVGIGSVAAQHAVLHLRTRAVERVIVAVIELIEKLDEFIAAPGLHAEIINVEIVALSRQRNQRHVVLLSQCR